MAIDSIARALSMRINRNLSTSSVKVFNTVSDMASNTSLSPLDTIQTNGYFSLNDGGGALYIISTIAYRACSIPVYGGLYAVLIGDSFNTRQIGIRSGDRAQDTINAYIADTSFTKLTVVDEIHLKKDRATPAPFQPGDVDVIDIVKIRRNQFWLEFFGNGKFVLDTINDDNTRMIAISGSSNSHVHDVTIIYPILVGDAATNQYVDSQGNQGEYGHGICMYYADKIRVYGGDIRECYGDAVVVSTDTNDVNFIGTLYCESCRRQGVSVSNGKNIFFDTIIGKNINATLPGAVIDFEPNHGPTGGDIVGGVKMIHAIDCNAAALVAGPYAKEISFGTIISDHSDNQNYECDFWIIGGFWKEVVNDVVVNHLDDYKNVITVDNIIVSNSQKKCVQFEKMTESIAVNIKNVQINGCVKTTANSAAEATVYFKNYDSRLIQNITIDHIEVINNTSAVVSLGVFQNVAATYKNVEINYRDDSTQLVTCALYGSTLVDTHITSNKNADGNQFLNSTGEFYVTTGATNFTVGSSINHIFVANPQGSNINMYKTNLSGYTINTADFITDGSYYTFTGCHAFTLYFNHTNKQINATKIA